MKRFKSKRSYRKYTAYVKMHRLSKERRGHTVRIHGRLHRVRHRRR